MNQKTSIPFSQLTVDAATEKYFETIGNKLEGGFVRLLKDYVEKVVKPANSKTWLGVQFRCEEIALDAEEMMETAREIAELEK